MRDSSTKINGSTEISEPKSEALQGPQGARMALNLSPSILNPGAGKRVQKGGPDELVGYIWGTIHRGFRHANFKDATKESVRWHGVIASLGADGTAREGDCVYLPGVLERNLKSLGCPLVAEGDPRPPAFQADFSVEIWCEADPPGTIRPTALGYAYAIYQRNAYRPNVNHLAPPEARAALGLPAPEVGDGRSRLAYLGSDAGARLYDPETGEIVEAGQEAPGEREPVAAAAD